MPHNGTYLHSSSLILLRSPLAASDPGGPERCEYRDFGMEMERSDSAYLHLHPNAVIRREISDLLTVEVLPS